MKKGDTVRIRLTDITGVVTKVEGHHILVKSEAYPVPVMFYADELELIASAPVTPIPCTECGHAHQVTNDDETQYAVYCACGVGQIGATKDEAAAKWNELHANIGRCVFDE